MKLKKEENKTTVLINSFSGKILILTGKNVGMSKFIGSLTPMFVICEVLNI